MRSFQEQRPEGVRSGSDRMRKLSGEAQAARKVEDGAGGEVCAERHSHRRSMSSGGAQPHSPILSQSSCILISITYFGLDIRLLLDKGICIS